jgi:TonB family protein
MRQRFCFCSHAALILSCFAVLLCSYACSSPDEQDTAKAVTPTFDGPESWEDPVLIEDTAVEPTYPPTADAAVVDGSVWVTFLVTSRGDTKEHHVLKEEPSGYGFGDAAIEAVRSWRYEPATRQGQPISLYVTTVINFTASDESPGGN